MWGMAETLRLASVNVNGVRAAFRKGMGDWLEQRGVDVLAMQEVRADDAHLEELFGRVEDSGWHILHDPCAIKGRAGVAIASRIPGAELREYDGGHPFFFQDPAALPEAIAKLSSLVGELPLLGRALANASYSSCRARVSIRRLAFRTG